MSTLNFQFLFYIWCWVVHEKHFKNGSICILTISEQKRQAFYFYPFDQLHSDWKSLLSQLGYIILETLG